MKSAILSRIPRQKAKHTENQKPMKVTRAEMLAASESLEIKAYAKSLIARYVARGQISYKPNPQAIADSLQKQKL